MDEKTAGALLAEALKEKKPLNHTAFVDAMKRQLPSGTKVTLSTGFRDRAKDES